MPKFKVGDRIAPIVNGLPNREVVEVFPDGYTLALHHFDSVADISRWDMDEADNHFEVPITREEHERVFAKAEESVQKVIDAYCRYYLADDDSREERVALSQLEIELASLAIEVRGDNFLIAFAAVLEGK